MTWAPRLRHAIGLAALTAAYGVGAAAAPAWASERDHFNDPYSIMAPEPWLAPRYNSPRGLPQRPRNAPRVRVAPPRVSVAPPAPPIVLPSGQSVPNLPPVNQGMVPGMAAPGAPHETFGDRALRCTHQSALFGVPAGQQGAYMNSCAMGQ